MTIRSILGSLGGLRSGRGTRRLFLTRRRFDREATRERVRASRRGMPFCLLTLKLAPGPLQTRQSDELARVLMRRLRSTDGKGMFAVDDFAVLLVDTPEMGGRVVVDRLQNLFADLSLLVEMELKVHDPQGFDVAGSIGADESTRSCVQLSAREVSVSSEWSLVKRPAVEVGVKRTIDLIGALTGMVCFGPILLVAIAAIRLGGPGPIFYRQTREGMWGKAFTIYKLRTMVVGAEYFQADLRKLSYRDGPAFKIKDDPRVTPVGKILRATCIDELPQLWNVLKGEMSLVGPRPLPWHESRSCSRWHRRRLDILPGLTCFWQVDKARAQSFDDWMRLDLEYVDRRNLWVDASLVLKTFAVALSRRGGQ